MVALNLSTFTVSNVAVNPRYAPFRIKTVFPKRNFLLRSGRAYDYVFRFELRIIYNRVNVKIHPTYRELAVQFLHAFGPL